MRILSSLATMLIAMVVALPLAAQDAKKDKKKPAKPAKVERKEKKGLSLKSLFSFAGTITKMEQGRITVKVTRNVTLLVSDAPQRKAQYQRAVFGYQRSLAQRQLSLQRQLLDIQRARNAQERVQRVAAYQRSLRQRPPTPPTPPQLYEKKTLTNDVIVRTGAKMIVRAIRPELQFDDKGNIVEFTKEKLKELAGPEGYPGFPAQLSALGSNMQAQFYLAPIKGKKKNQKGKTNIADILGGPAGGQDQLDDPNMPTVLLVVVNNATGFGKK